jgi:hypothetical protein
MANEIEMSARLYASKNGASINNQLWQTTCNMTGTDMGQQTQEVGPSSELLDITADLSLPYKILIYNMDLVNDGRCSVSRWNLLDASPSRSVYPDTIRQHRIVRSFIQH